MAHADKRGAEAGRREAIAEEPARTEHPDTLCAPDPYAATPGKRLARARARAAWLFDDLLDRYHLAGKHAYSRRNLAERFVGDSESVVRKWASGDKPMPVAALLLLPDEVFEDLVAEIRRRRGGR